jgi:quercetin dioxygenase-like cupin family protein
MPNDEKEISAQQNDLQDPNEAPSLLTDPSPTVSRRSFVGTAALASASLLSSAAIAQSRQQAESGRQGDNASDPGPENATLQGLNPNSSKPPFTDTGNPGPNWYSFDITPKRLEAGGWTHQVTERELPPSKDLAGVNMRLTAGSFRELHWHLADEWAIMLSGKSRVTIMQSDGKMFIDDIERGDLWYFPAGLPHSIQVSKAKDLSFCSSSIKVTSLRPFCCRSSSRTSRLRLSRRTWDGPGKSGISCPPPSSTSSRRHFLVRLKTIGFPRQQSGN